MFVRGRFEIVAGSLALSSRYQQSKDPCIYEPCASDDRKRPLQDGRDAITDVFYHARTGINSRADYEKLYRQSIEDPASFWANYAKDFYWYKKVYAAGIPKFFICSKQHDSHQWEIILHTT